MPNEKCIKPMRPMVLSVWYKRFQNRRIQATFSLILINTKKNLKPQNTLTIAKGLPYLL
jgi:hypothetical protein